MPVSGNDEPRVVARQSSNSWSVLPIKKRYSMIYRRAPLHTVNESKTKGSGLNSCGSTGKSDTPNNSLPEVKEEVPLGAKVDSPETNPKTSSGPSSNVGDPVKPALAEKLAVTKEVVAKQGESHSKFGLPADSGHVELSLGPKKPHVSSLVDPNTKESCLMRGTVNPSLLSQKGSCKNADDTLRGFDSSVLQSLVNVDSSRVSPNSSLLENLALNRKMNSPTCKTVNSESVVETLVQANAGTAVRPDGTFEANVVNTEVVRQNLKPIELSTKELLEQKPVICDLIQEVSLEISMTSDVIALQSIGRDLQLQESSSSRFSTPSEYFVHTNEANRSKNVLDQANADIAAKNANFDLKESNVSSDKVEASVSAGMNIEDLMVCRKTQDTHNLVASGEGSEDECYGFDYESDEEYEEGEIREPMMQSISEGMDSGKNNEYSSKNVHTESYADFVKRCDEKAEKMNLLSPVHPVTGRSLSSRSGRKMYYYMEEEKFHLPRNRFEDRSFGSSRGNFMRGRGSRFHRDWYPERDFESYGGEADYRFRHKRTAPWLNDAAFAYRTRKTFQQYMYDGPDCHFVEGNTNFTAMQRRGFPRMRSKSPVRSRTWSSPRRRFNGHQDSSQDRFPVMYREDRTRSSSQRCDSPSYTDHHLNDMRNVDAVQEHVHPRSLSSRRSPPDRVFTSTNRRVERLDHRERVDGDGSGESTDERRKYRERQGGPRQMRNVEEKEDEFDLSKLKKRRF
ncbi:uncharacterized protein LOC129869932 [Solanum dulcamara]|uniref:uncharacterized protein LOC129869932 n=1 Tax=Solanum dulcamara TaxID=45834 RepID=UPI002486094F|nr:uncharacterized protein LOC129869932 [Solanum dulcamara]